MARERRLVMADPSFFEVAYAINPHMRVGAADPDRARAQWSDLRSIFEGLGLPVWVLPPKEGLPDLVFTANQTFPAPPVGGRPRVVLGHMAHAERRPEVSWVAEALRTHGVDILTLPDPEARFEGTGDGAWWPGRRLVVGGWGFRTDRGTWDHLAALLEVPVLRLRLVDPRLYHLDTAFQLLDGHTALYVEEAFDEASLALLRATVPRLLRVPLAEAVGGLACNGYSPDGRHYVVQEGNPRTAALVRGAGLEVIEVDTREFLASGGSVYCLKLQVYGAT